MIPDWQLPAGVDRGLHDYMNSRSMVAGYDAMMAESPLAAVDVQYSLEQLPASGRVLDAGCGTGRLAIALAQRGNITVGCDLSTVMLEQAEFNRTTAGISDTKLMFTCCNLAETTVLPHQPFAGIACLFSTLGMLRGIPALQTCLQNFFTWLQPGGVLIVHVHNRTFRGLGVRGWFNPVITMPQAYSGAALSLTHFSLRGIRKLLQQAGFHMKDEQAISVNGTLQRPTWHSFYTAYGYLLCSIKPI